MEIYETVTCCYENVDEKWRLKLYLACSYGVDLKFQTFTDLDSRESCIPAPCLQAPLVGQEKQ